MSKTNKTPQVGQQSIERFSQHMNVKPYEPGGAEIGSSPIGHTESAMANPEPTSRVQALGSLLLGPFIGKASRRIDSMPDIDPADSILVEAFEKRHFIRGAPRLPDLVNNTTRTNKYSYRLDVASTRKREYGGTLSSAAPIVSITEHEGLVETYDFPKRIKRIAEKMNVVPGSELAEAADKAKSILDATHFIGDHELEEATKGFAALWKEYLRKDARQKICVPSGYISTGEDMKKSSEYLFDRVLSHFNKEELDAYGPRILRDMSQIGRRDTWTKIILLDDWSISGTQLRRGINKVMLHKRGGTDKLNQVEVHLIAASDSQLKNNPVPGHSIATFAYFKCPDSSAQNPAPRVTGTHSSVDFKFEDDIEGIVQTVNNAVPDARLTMPPLTNIVRQYR